MTVTWYRLTRVFADDRPDHLIAYAVDSKEGSLLRKVLIERQYGPDESTREPGVIGYNLVPVEVSQSISPAST